MDIIKIGKFIAENRKNKKLTQEQLAEKLGVTSKTISRWENGNYMPDISLLKPLSEELGVTLNELLSGEKIDKEKYQEKLEENIINTIDYTSKKVYESNKIIAELIIIFGLVIAFIAFTIFPSDSSWGSIYSIIGTIVSLVGFSKLNKKKTFIKRMLLNFGYFLLILISLILIDFVNVQLNHVPPRFAYIKETRENIITYKATLYNVYRINYDTKSEYYIIDTKREFTRETLPISPFNRDKAGIDNIIKYKNKYVGNNSNDMNLVRELPMSEYGYTIQIDSENLGLTINYHITDWYINEDKYLEKSLLYNSVSIFSLIENVQSLAFNFSGKTYTIDREKIEELYPNYKEINNDGIDKDNFNMYLENKMNDYEFVENAFNILFE